MSRIARELHETEHRPKTRRYINLTNEELAVLFKVRAAKIAELLEPHTFWSNNRIVYWSQFAPLQEDLYEVMLEIQSRYPSKEYFRALPVAEPRDIST